MKTKTINKVIKFKIEDWLSTIEDPSLNIAIRRDIIVTGGCIPSMLLGEPVNDFDVYIRTKDTLKRLVKYYLKRQNFASAWLLDEENPDKEVQEVLSKEIKTRIMEYPDKDRLRIIIPSAGIASEKQYVEDEIDQIADEVDYNIEAYFNELNRLKKERMEKEKEEGIEKKPYRVIFLSPNAITLSDKIQIIVRFFGTPEEIHKNFDFVHVMQYWTYDEGLVLNAKSLEAILTKELLFEGSKYPIAALIRTRKFIKRGWRITAGEIFKMTWLISKLDLTDRYVLEDQLVGVDSLYFNAFLNALKGVTNEKLTTTYLFNILDRIFR